MSGCNGRALSVRKAEAIVSYPHTKKALIPSVSARGQGRFASSVVLPPLSPGLLPSTARIPLPASRFRCTLSPVCRDPGTITKMSDWATSTASPPCDHLRASTGSATGFWTSLGLAFCGSHAHLCDLGPNPSTI